MRISVNTRFLLPGVLEGFGVYTNEIMKRMVKAFPGDEFHFYFDRNFSSSYVYGPNVRAHVLHPQARHPLLFRYWFQVPVKRALIRHKAQVFFSPDSFIPLGKVGVPRVMTLHDVAYKRFPDHVGKSHRRFYERYMPQFIAESSKVITVSQFSKREICEFFSVPEEKVVVVYNGVSEDYEPRTEQDIKSARERHTAGHPYLLYIGAIHPRKNIAMLIRAFDRYRAAAGSDGHKLVIAGRYSWQFEDVNEALARSPHKSDIHLLGYVDDATKKSLLHGATGLVNISLYEGFGLQVVEAQASGVPVIVSSIDSTGGALAEIAGRSAFEADPYSTDSIQFAIEQLVANAADTARAQKGIDNAKRYDWISSSRQTHDVLEAAHSEK